MASSANNRLADEMRPEGSISMFKAAAVPLASFTLTRLIGFGIAWAIYESKDTAAFDDKVAFLSQYELGYLYASAVVLSWTVAWLNYFPVALKNTFMHITGNLRSNLFIYKVSNVGQEEKGQPHVLLDQEGGIGKYNRANRSMHHFTENVGGILLCIAASGFVFPRPAMVSTMFLCFGRIVHQVGYVVAGFGGHGVGWFIWAAATCTLEMLVLIAACKAM